MHSPSRQERPSPADIQEFSERRRPDREVKSRKPADLDDAWQWFLSLFDEQNRDESDDRPARRAA